MREIKFKLFHIKSQKMLESTITIQDAYNGASDEYNNEINAEECEWLQYTGLKDVNGVEYFEGNVFHPLYNKLGNHIVTFKNGKFNISDFSPLQCEIIGNIYENKELIK
ncbi:MAG: hypothetical protein ACI9N9_001188 [Enterobacterales bacterium]|jgi:hypothetical protein